MSTAISIGPDLEWRAESDMRTLVEAQAIRNDKKRYAAAQKMAVKKAEEMELAFSASDDKSAKAGKKAA